MATTRIGLYGPFGWGNLGDAAIQEAMLHNVRRRIADVEFVGISLNPQNTTAIHGIEAIPILRSWSPPAPESASAPTAPPTTRTAATAAPRLAGLRKLLRTGLEFLRELRFHVRNTRVLRDLDLLVVSGGGQISDDWGGPLDHPWSMFMWTLMARCVGTEVAIVSVGAGPIDAPLSRRLFFAALRLARWRSVRDDESAAYLRQAGCSLPVQVYPDLAFSHPLPASGARNPTARVTGISPMSWMHPQPGVWPEQDAVLYERHLDTLARFTESLRARGEEVVLFTNQIRNDRFAHEDLLARVEGLDAGQTRDLPHLLQQIAATDIVVTSRLHGAILAFLQGRAVIALSYESKIDAVMRQFGQTAARLPIESADAEALELCYLGLVDHLGATQEHILTVARSHRARLDQQYDRLFGTPLEAR